MRPYAPSPQATIAFVPREQFGTTERSLETLYARTAEPFELVCVDGASPPRVREYLERAAREHGFTLLRTEQYLTPNQARNLAIAQVRTPYVVFVDNDVLVSPGWLAPLVECAQETGAWVVGPLYFEFEPECDKIHMFGGECRIVDGANGRDYVERHHFAHRRIGEIAEPLTRRETELIEFHTVLVAMEAFRLLGPLDEGLLCNAEHGDLCLQVRSLGQRVFVEPQSRITYAPPKELAGADLEYFQLRWSEAWSQANNNRLREKWDLGANAQGLALSLKWVAGHRRYSVQSLATMRRVLGRKVTSWIEKRIVAEREAEENRRQYPTELYGRPERPKVCVVHDAGLNRQAAA